MRLLVLLFAVAATLPAEFLEVRMQVGDMDCASCVQSMQAGLKRIRGVEKIEIAGPTTVAFTLAPGNKVTLERLRDAIKGIGFTPRDAQVVARGKAVTAEGKWRFEIDGLGKAYNLAASQEATIKALRAQDGQLVTVRAHSAPPPDPRTEPSLNVEALVESK